jgi:hypothetical protein
MKLQNQEDDSFQDKRKEKSILTGELSFVIA